MLQQSHTREIVRQLYFPTLLDANAQARKLHMADLSSLTSFVCQSFEIRFKWDYGAGFRLFV